jgi:type I restriction enzyme S subunit
MAIENWLNVPLGEIATIRTGKLDSNASVVDGKYPFFTCSPDTLAIDDYAFDCEAVILAGNNANGIFSVKHYRGMFNAYQRTYVITARNPGKLDTRYLYYRIKSLAEGLGTLSIGSATKFLTMRILEPLPIPLPPLNVQRRIAEILGAFDDKIELNRRTNETLESLARALFKSWFIDFDPVHAKATGHHPPGLTPTTAALFPAEFQPSELGDIPKGWKTGSLYDVAKFINGAAFRTGDFCEPVDGIPVVKIAELKDGITAQTKYSNRETTADRMIETGDLLYSWSGSPETSLDAFLWSNGLGLLNQHIFKIVTPNLAQRRFVYYLLKHLRPVLVGTAKDKQTTGLGHVTVADMKRLKVCHPPGQTLEAFDRRVAPIFNSVLGNTIESQTLATLRDALLPKLLSGELSAVEASEAVA